MNSLSKEVTAMEYEDTAMSAPQESDLLDKGTTGWETAATEPLLSDAAYTAPVYHEEAPYDSKLAPGTNPDAGAGGWSNEPVSYSANTPGSVYEEGPALAPGAEQGALYNEEMDDSIDNCTVILRGTKLVGDLQTDEDIVIAGSIKGNVSTIGRISLGGQVIGDVQSQSIELAGAVIKGNILVEDQLLMDKDTTVIGNIKGREAEIAGRVKGNLSVEKLIYIRETAILMGNITSEAVHIEEGAILMGDVVITPDQNGVVQVDEPEFDISLK